MADGMTRRDAAYCCEEAAAAPVRVREARELVRAPGPGDTAGGARSCEEPPGTMADVGARGDVPSADTSGVASYTRSAPSTPYLPGPPPPPAAAAAVAAAGLDTMLPPAGLAGPRGAVFESAPRLRRLTKERVRLALVGAVASGAARAFADTSATPVGATIAGIVPASPSAGTATCGCSSPLVPKAGSGEPIIASKKGSASARDAGGPTTTRDPPVAERKAPGAVAANAAAGRAERPERLMGETQRNSPRGQILARVTAARG